MKHRVLSLLMAFIMAVSLLPAGVRAQTQSTAETALHAIAAANTENSGEWWIMDMAAYAKAYPHAAGSTDAAKQSYINAAAEAVAEPGPFAAQTYAKAEIILRAIGRDCSRLYPAGGGAALNVPALLAALPAEEMSVYDAPWVLLADLQGDLGLSDAQRKTLISVLRSGQSESGLLGYDFGGSHYDDPDTTATAVAALASFYKIDPDATLFVEGAVQGLSSLQTESGSFGNANTDAMVITGLAAIGVDPAADDRFIKNGNSLLDGLLSHLNEDGTAFRALNWTTGALEDNALATEQGFRALIAADRIAKTGAAYNVYDFHANEVEPTYAAGSGGSQEPEKPGGKLITVTVTIRADDGYWMNGKSVTVPGEGATVYHAFIKALEGSGITQTGAERGYVSSMAKDGTVLAQFTHGKNSGWLYTVNGTLPSVGLTDYGIFDGDRILWYYTDDWTRDPAAGSSGGGVAGPAEPVEPAKPTEPTESAEQLQRRFADVFQTAWYAEDVSFVCEKGLMTGVSEERFAPDTVVTRGQAVVVLWRLAGSPKSAGREFTDVRPGAWYEDAAAWASANGIADGYADGRFGADDEAAREQLAAMLYRYVKMQGGGFTGMWYFPLRYDDASAVSAWADEAMHWCVMNGLLSGTDENRLEPKAAASRAQLAAILRRFLTLAEETDASAAERASAGAAAYLLSAVPEPQYGAEWAVFALARSGASVDKAYFDGYRAALESAVRENAGVLSERRHTEYSRVILALAALDEDARNAAGLDLTLPLGDYKKTVAQGVNGAIYALLALDSRAYPMPQNGGAGRQATRQDYVDCILSAQRADGGWSFTDGGDADPDLTAMVLQALAGYREQSGVGAAIDRALVCLSALQDADGGFSSWGTANAESCAQTLIALTALGIDVEDGRFVKNGRSALDALLGYQAEDGGFRHVREGETNLMASEQALCALAAVVRAERGAAGLYRMDAVELSAAA